MFRFLVPLLLYLILELVALTTAFAIHFVGHIDARAVRLWQCAIPIVLLVKTTVFATFGDWQRQSRPSFPKELLAIAGTAALSCGLISAATQAGLLDPAPPLRLIGLDCAVSMLIRLLLRSCMRMEPISGKFSPRREQACRALLVDVDGSSDSVAQQLSKANSPLKPVAILSTHRPPKASSRSTIPIFSIRQGFDSIVRRCAANTVLIPDSIPGDLLRRLVKENLALGLDLRILVDAHLLLSESHAPNIRGLTIDDAHRTTSARSFNAVVTSVFAEKTVLVTGAAGGIGSECCRQILKLNPKTVILVDQSEVGLWKIEQELNQFPSSEIQKIYAVCDVTDQVTLGRVFSEQLPDIVIHAAGYHDLSLMKRNVQTAIRNNVLGTRSVVDVADRFGIERFVLVSSHGAFHPIDIIGATDRLSERYVLAQGGASTTQFMAIRLGNGLGTSGCPTRLLQQWIETGVVVNPPNVDDVIRCAPIADLVHRLLAACAEGKGGQLLAVAPGPAIQVEQLIQDATSLARQQIAFSSKPVTTMPRSQPKEPNTLEVRIANAPCIAEGVHLIEPESAPSRQIKLDLQLLERATHGDVRDTCRVLGNLIPEFVAHEPTRSLHRAELLSKSIVRGGETPHSTSELELELRALLSPLQRITRHRHQSSEPVVGVSVVLDDVEQEVVRPAKRPDGNSQ